MAYINVPEGVPGIRSLVMFRPETGKPLYELAQILLREPSSAEAAPAAATAVNTSAASALSPAERELIAAYVSSRNHCMFCCRSHAAAARVLYGGQEKLVDETLADPDTSALSAKMKALLHIAGQVQISGKNVMQQDITAAREQGANDRDIHDTVLIAAAFSMFNRYVDGLASWTPTDPAVYKEMGIRMAEKGYVPPGAAPAGSGAAIVAGSGDAAGSALEATPSDNLPNK